MSFNPPSNVSHIFNPNNFVGVDDITGNQKIILDLANYVRSDAGVFTSDIQTEKNLIINNETQSVAFTDSKNTDLAIVKDRTTEISYASNQTTIAGDLQVSGNLLINDNNLSIAKINNLQTKLNEIDTNLGNINSNDNDITTLNNFVTSQTAKNALIDISLTDLENELSIHDTSLIDIDNTIMSYNTWLTNLDAMDSVHDTSLNNLINFQESQETYNTNNDSTISSLQSDISNNTNSITQLQSDISSNDLDITNLQTKDIQQDASLNNILTSISNLESQDTILQTNINNNDNDISTLNTSVSAINTTLSSHTTSISNLDTLTGNHTSSINSLNSLTTTHDSSLNSVFATTTTLSGNMASAQADIIQNASDISTKQNTLSSSNRLNATYIADGSVSNAMFQTLGGINTGSTIESRLTTLSNSINNLDIDQTVLENLQNVDLSNFAVIGTDITNLQNKDLNIDISLNDLNTIVATAQSSIASNTERLNVKDSEITTINNSITSINTDILANTSDIALNTTDIGTNQSDIATLQSEILTKQDIIDVSNNLPSSVVSTNVNDSPSTLNVVLQDLRDVNDTQSTSISNISSSISNLTNSIASNDTEILALQNQDTTHSNAISTINSNISSINTTLSGKQDTIVSLDSSLINDVSENDTLNNIIVRIDNDIATKQDIIDASNKVAIVNVDLSGSNLVYADYGSSVNSKFASLDGQISTLTTLQNGDVANFTAIDENFTTIDASLNQIVSDISNVHYLDGVNANVQSQIDGLISSNLPSLTYDSGSTTTTIANNCKVTKLIFNNDSSEQVTAFTNALSSSLSTAVSDVSTLQTEMTTAETNIAQNTSDILQKQNLINGSNKLDPQYIDASGGVLSSQKMEYLSTITEDINTKFTNIDSVLSNQATLNTSVSSDISTLQSGKQNTLTEGSLNPNVLQTSGAGVMDSTKMQYLTSVTSDLQTQLNSKVGTNDTTFTGTTTADNIVINGPISTDAIYETVQSSYTSYSSNVLTYDYSNGAILYFPLSSNTNFQISLTNVPTVQYNTYTFTLILNTATNVAYANTCKINGTTQTLVANGGLANVDVTNVTSSGLLMQQFTIIWTGSLYKVITNISEFY